MLKISHDISNSSKISFSLSVFNNALAPSCDIPFQAMSNFFKIIFDWKNKKIYL